MILFSNIIRKKKDKSLCMAYTAIKIIWCDNYINFLTRDREAFNDLPVLSRKPGETSLFGFCLKNTYYYKYNKS